MDLPKTPRPGEPIRAAWGIRLLQFLRSMRLTAGPGIRINRSPNGMTISATRRPGGGAAPSTDHPWRPYLAPYLGEGDPPADQPLRIRVIPGTVANRLPGNWNQELTLPASTNGRWVWLEVTIIDSGAVTGASIRMGTTPPTADLVSSDGSLPTTLYAPLFAVDTGEESVSRFYIVQDENLKVIISNNDGGCSEQRRSVQLVDATADTFS